MAVIQAYDVADRIRANRAGINAGNYNNINSTPTDPGCAQTLCTPQQLAQLDAHEWNTANASLLPAGTGTVVRNPNGETFTIRIQWDDERLQDMSAACGIDDEDAETSGCFALEFRP